MGNRARFSPIAALRRQAPTILGISLAALAGTDSRAADPSQGATLAQRWCASCHLVATGQKQASADVPAFAAIAARTDFTPEKIAVFLRDPHPPMPNFSLSRSEIADIAAYIGSLRK